MINLTNAGIHRYTALKNEITPKIYKRILIPAFLISVCAYLDRINLSYAALTMNRDLGFSAEVFGFGAGIFFIGYLLFAVPGALIAEKYSATRWLSGIMIAWGVVAGLMAFVESAWQFYALRFLLGAFEASLYPVFYATVIPRWFADSQRPFVLSVLLTSLQVSGIVGAPVAGWLVGVPLFHLEGWQVLFLAEAAPPIVLALLLPRWMADRPSDATWLKDEEKQFLTAHTTGGVKTDERRARHGEWWRAMGDKIVMKLCLTYFLWIIGFWAFGYWLPTVVKSATGWTNLETGFALVLPMALSLIAMLWNGSHSSKTGERRWHVAISLFVGGAGMLLCALTDNSLLTFAFLCVAGIGIYAPMGIWWSLPSSFLSGTVAAGAAGLINSFGNMGGFVGPYMTGLLKDLTGDYKWAWIVLAVCVCSAAMLVLTLQSDLRRVEGTVTIDSD